MRRPHLEALSPANAGLDIGNATRTPPEGGVYSLAPPPSAARARRYPLMLLMTSFLLIRLTGAVASRAHNDGEGSSRSATTSTATGVDR